MGFLNDIDFDNVPDLQALEEGEYELRIMSAEDYVGKTSGKASVRVVLEVIGQPDAEMIFHYISLPNANDDERAKNSKLRRAKAFLSFFDIPQEADYPEWVGKTCWALLSVEPDQNGVDRNSIRRLIK